MRNLFKFIVTSDTLEIRPDVAGDPLAQEELAESRDFFDAIEFQLCNGWSLVPPEEIGALTSGTILAEDIEYSDDGKIVSLKEVFWDDAYETRDALESLKQGKTVSFRRVPVEFWAGR
jgi:hypothetical protein